MLVGQQEFFLHCTFNSSYKLWKHKNNKTQNLSQDEYYWQKYKMEKYINITVDVFCASKRRLIN